MTPNFATYMNMKVHGKRTQMKATKLITAPYFCKPAPLETPQRTDCMKIKKFEIFS